MADTERSIGYLNCSYMYMYMEVNLIHVLTREINYFLFLFRLQTEQIFPLKSSLLIRRFNIAKLSFY